MPARSTTLQPTLALLAFACLLAAVCLIAAPRAAAETAPVTVTDYTDKAEALGWGKRSHWKQPWRSYMDTVPGSTLRNAVGINFNVNPKAAASTARLLAEDGFRRARIELGWNNLDYDDPSRLNPTGLKNLETYLTALRDNGIRPLILLNANDGKPCPVRLFNLHLTQPAPEGATVIHISPGDVAEVVPGRTGIKGRGKAAFHLITSVSTDGVAQLSKPLFSSYPAGELKGETLLYEPFASPLLANGDLNPRFKRTIDGWLDYVGLISREAERVLGSEAFDVEIWNELSFGSAFLNINKYYEPDLEEMRGSVIAQTLNRTIVYLRNPANGTPNVGIGNGFSNQRPWANGNESPLGLSAIDKHPYAGWEKYPASAQVNGNQPLDGLGQLDGWFDADKQYHEVFTPTYDAFLPERFLTGLYTETLIYDLSPHPTKIFGVEHGRHTHPPGGSPPKMWVTEVNMSPTSGPTPAGQMSAADIRHLQTKIALRYLTAFVNKGVEAIHLYGASAGSMSIVENGFLQAAAANPTVYPGRELGGGTVAAVGRLTAAMKGSRITAPRDLELRSLTDFNSNLQFEGSSADPVKYPPLYNRDVFAFFPFQTSNSRFVIPVYVMSRNVAENHSPDDPTDPTRFDLPEERYRLQIGGIDGTEAGAGLLDPVSGESTPVGVISAAADEIVVDVEVTDSPRLLIIQEGGQNDSGEPEAPLPLPVGIGEAPAEPVENPTDPEGPVEEEEEEREAEPEEESGSEREEAPGGGSGAGKSHPGSAGPRGADSQEAGAVTADLNARIGLRRPRALLSSRRQVRVAGRCAPKCALVVAGSLTIKGRRSYRMFQHPPRRSADKSLSPALTLGISARMAKIARRALRQGVPVKLVVSGRAGYGSGLSRPVRSTAVLRP